MRIGIVINTSWNVFNFRLNLIKAIRERGHNIVVIAPKDAYSEKLKEDGFEFFHLPLDNKGTNPIKEFFQVFTFYKVYKEAKVDLVLQYTIKPNIYGSIACGMLGIKAINNVSGLGAVFITESFITKVVKKLYKWAFKVPSTVFFQNNDDRMDFLKYGLLEERKTKLLPGSGVDLSKFKPKEFKKNKSFTFLMVSRLLYDKGIVEFLEAAEKLKYEGLAVKFIICGKTEPEKKKGLTEEEFSVWLNKDIIEYKGHVDNVYDFIEQADCVVLPSYREGTPRSLLEAAAMGKPIVTTNVPGCREVVIAGYNGFLCEARSTESLYLSLKKMHNSSEIELEKMSANSRSFVEEKFDEQIVIQKYITEIGLLGNGN